MIQIALATIALAIGAGQATASASPCGESTRPPAQLTAHQLRTSVLCLVNRARERHGIHRLRFNRRLRNSATAHSHLMIASGLFTHGGPGGSTVTTRVTRFGYLVHASRYFVAENIGAGVGRANGSPFGMVRLWMHSPPHRANILDPSLRDFGVGIARGDVLTGSSHGVTYTLDFGSRR
jgi:uncharacterized protein YkwD